MSFKDLLVGVGILEVVPDEPKTDTTPQLTKPTIDKTPMFNSSLSQPIVQSINIPTQNIGTGIVDSKYVDHFVKILDDTKSKYPDTDYYAFSKAFQNTASMQSSVTEQLRYQIVFGTLAASGLNKEKLLASANNYLESLADDKKDYLKTSNDKSEVLKKENEDKNAKVQALLAEIQTANENINTINQKQQNFLTTFDSVYGQIQTDLNKITQYLQ